MKSRGLVVTAASPALAVAAAFTPAHAATASTGWRVVLTQHFGAAANTSAYETVAATGVGDAWVFGGTSVTLGGPAGTGRPVAEHWTGAKWTPSALTSPIKPAGSAEGVHLAPFQCSATGLPVPAGPPSATLVPPKTHASPTPGAASNTSAYESVAAP